MSIGSLYIHIKDYMTSISSINAYWMLVNKISNRHENLNYWWKYKKRTRQIANRIRSYYVLKCLNIILTMSNGFTINGNMFNWHTFISGNYNFVSNTFERDLKYVIFVFRTVGFWSIILHFDNQLAESLIWRAVSL